jgi:shikimate dehydrogenase
MIKSISGTTKVLGIIGKPVRHSLSPLMQNAALQAIGLDYIYLSFEVADYNLSQAISGLRALGVAGFNVTIPHKTAVIPYLDDLDESAIAAGAVNTVKNNTGRFTGYNTDGEGLIKSLADDLDFKPQNSTIVVIGAGGAARGAIASLCQAGTKRIIIVNRTQNKASELASVLSARFPETEMSISTGYEDLYGCLPQVDLLINTTSLGMNRENIPFLQLKDLAQMTRVYDMVYSPSVTPLLFEASKLGLRCANGLGMLAAQGELAFAVWTGEIPPFGVMKSTLYASLASQQQLDN